MKYIDPVKFSVHCTSTFHFSFSSSASWFASGATLSLVTGFILYFLRHRLGHLHQSKTAAIATTAIGIPTFAPSGKPVDILLPLSDGREVTTGGWLSVTKLVDEVEVLVDDVPLLLKVLVAIAAELIAPPLDRESIAPVLDAMDSKFSEFCDWSTRDGELVLVGVSILYVLCSGTNLLELKK